MVEDLDKNKKNRNDNIVLLSKRNRFKNIVFVLSIVCTILSILSILEYIKLSKCIQLSLYGVIILGIYCNPSYSIFIRDKVIKAKINKSEI